MHPFLDLVFPAGKLRMREWVELFDELRPEVSPGLEEKMYVRSEVELLHSMQHLFFMLLLC